MIYTLPYTVEIDGKEYKIRNNCDFRVILDVIEALNDNDLDEQTKIKCALFIFFEDGELERIENFEEAIRQMFLVLNVGEENTSKEKSTEAPLMNWNKDFSLLAPPVSKVLGYDLRSPEKFTHWWSLVGAYMEIGECTFSNVVSIRKKLREGKKLEKHEIEFYRNNKEMIQLEDTNLTDEEKEFLSEDW